MAPRDALRRAGRALGARWLRTLPARARGGGRLIAGGPDLDPEAAAQDPVRVLRVLRGLP